MATFIIKGYKDFANGPCMSYLHTRTHTQIFVSRHDDIYTDLIISFDGPL